MESEGPKLWYILHSLVYNYDINNEYHKLYVYQFLKLFKNLIPCNKCKKFYINFIKKYDPYIHIKENNLVNWSISLHNTVNSKKNKEQMNKIDIDKIYLNKKIDNNIILNYLADCFYSRRIDNNELVKFIYIYQNIYPFEELRYKIIKINIEENLLIESLYSFKKLNKLIEKYKNLRDTT